MLKQKDAYFLYLEWLNLTGGTNGSNSNGGINGLGDAMDKIFGGWATGELDRGILPMA
ncbi:MAG: hypothetical protein R2828_00805 [Saprospiraceae bacterium]